MVQNPIARHWVFQMPISWSKAGLPLAATWCTPLYWIWGYVGRWIEAVRHHCLWPTQTLWCGLGVWFSSILIQSCGDSKLTIVLGVYHLTLANIFSHLRKSKLYSVGGECLCCLFLLPYVFMHNTPDKKLRNSHVPGYGSDWLAEIVAEYGQVLSNKFGSFFFYQRISVRFLCWWVSVFTIGLFQLFLNLMLCPDCYTEILWNFRTGASVWMPSSTACCFKISRGMNCHGACFSHRQYPSDSSLLHIKQNLK